MLKYLPHRNSTIPGSAIYSAVVFFGVINIIFARQIEEVRSCLMAFLNIIPPERHLFERALNQLKGARVLTIADAANLVNYGVMIGLVIKDDKVDFEVNHTVAKSEQLEISAQLVRLAKEGI